MCGGWRSAWRAQRPSTRCGGNTPLPSYHPADQMRWSAAPLPSHHPSCWSRGSDDYALHTAAYTHAACSPQRAACNPLRAACNPTCPRVDIFVAKGDPDGCMVNENSLSSGSDTWPHRMCVARLHLLLCYLLLATCYQVRCAALGGGARARTVRAVRQREQHASAPANGGGLATVDVNMRASMQMVVCPWTAQREGCRPRSSLPRACSRLLRVPVAGRPAPRGLLNDDRRASRRQAAVACHAR